MGWKPRILAVALLVGVPAVVVSTTTAGEEKGRVQPSRIIPLVVVAPGETKTVLFSVECTVGSTRGGGLAVTEMADGKPAPISLKKDDEKTFRRAGVTVTVPNMTEAPKFDAKIRAGALAALANVRPVFPVTVTADADAEPVAIDLHVLDATCSGHCHTDFTVVVTTPEETE